MPELPEVETVRAGLAAHLVGARVESVSILDSRSLKRHPGGPLDFTKTLVGNGLAAVVRRGKFLWLPLADQSGRALVGHLGMSGQILVRSPNHPADGQTRVVIGVKTAAGKPLEMRFVDQRLFGSLAIDNLVATSDGFAGGFGPEAIVADEIPATVSHIARDLLDPAFDRAAVLEKLRKRNSGIKRVLLDQGLASGIGNIYADESLWLAKLHFDQPASSLSKRKAGELIEIAAEVLRRAVLQGGTSFDEQYKNVNGEAGYFSQSLNAYGQTDKACPRCQTPIRRVAWANRGSHFCPRCQRLRASG